MKGLVLCVCLLIFVFSSSSELKQILKKAERDMLNDTRICAIEYGLSEGQSYTEEEILNNTYAEPGNEEKTRKHGCWVMCIMKRQNLIEGTNIKETQVHEKLNETMSDNNPSLGRAHRIARKCLKQVRDITPKCEKGFSLLACATRFIAIYELEHQRRAERYKGSLPNEEAEATTEVKTEQAK